MEIYGKLKKCIDYPKIFGIGLNKTGTTTLGECGKILGFRCTSYDRDLLEDVVLRNDLTRVRQRVAVYDLFEDWPWPLIYKDLDLMFPGSKFILTTRESEEKWLESLKRHSLRTHPTKHFRKLAYGKSFPQGNEKFYLYFYRKHNNDVREYFKHRGSDFKELCWENGDGFEQLCHFLGLDVPSCPFPHANKGGDARVGIFTSLANRLLAHIS